MNVERLVAVLEEQGFTVGDAEGGTELTIACTLCFDEKQRLYISTANGLWMCFHCRAKGHLRRLLIEVCGLNHNEAFVAERSIWGGAKRRPLPGRVRSVPPSPVGLPPGLVFDNGTGLAAEYLQSRGLSTRWVTELGLGYCLVGFYRYRVIVPVMTQGELRTFVARTWLKDEPKTVLMPKGSQAARALFGYDRLPCRPGPCEHLPILTEGVFDAIRMWDLGYHHTLATLGAHLTNEQRALLKRLAPRGVVLLRDGDAAGREAAIKEARELSAAMLDVSIAILPKGTDPGSARPPDIQQALDRALPVKLDLGIETLKEVHHNA